MPGFELFGEEERREVATVLQTGVLARYGFEAQRRGIWKAIDFEQALCRQFGCRYVQAVSSGTTALITAMAACNIGAGDEVIIPVLCDVACVEAVIQLGAVPVFADIDETLTLSPRSVSSKITHRTRAVLLVHALGSVGDLSSLKKICAAQELLLIEDVSEAIGATFQGMNAGTFGDIGICSFDAYSTLTCGEGGAIFCNDANLYKLCNEYSDHGHDHLAANRSEDNHRYMGTNYRISELHAAVGLAQVQKLSGILIKQRKLHGILAQELSTVANVAFKRTITGVEDACTHLSLFLPSVRTAELLVSRLKETGIPCAYWYDNNWRYFRNWTHFKNGSWMNRLYDDQKCHILQNTNQAFPVSDALMSRCISFAISLLWTEKDVASRGKNLAIHIHESLKIELSS